MVEIARLRDGREIGAVRRGGRRRAGRFAVVHVRERDAAGPVRLAVVASRRVGTAVARNRAKRLLREAARRVDWRPGTDVVLIARAACAGSRMPEVHRELVDLGRHLDVARSPSGGRVGSAAADRRVPA